MISVEVVEMFPTVPARADELIFIIVDIILRINLAPITHYMSGYQTKPRVLNRLDLANMESVWIQLLPRSSLTF